MGEIPNHVFDDVEVNWKKVTENSKDFNEYTVTFVSPATSGKQSMLRCNFKGCDFDGCQPRFTGIGKMNNEASGTDENAECSNRGICNTDDGVCECFEGYTGESCSIQTIWFKLSKLQSCGVLCTHTISLSI